MRRMVLICTSEVFFEFLYHGAEAEDDDVVAREYLRITVYQHALFLSHQSADGGTLGKVEVFDEALCDAGFLADGVYPDISLSFGEIR